MNDRNKWKEGIILKVKSDYLIYCDESCPLEYEPISLFGAIGCSYENKDKIVEGLRDLKNMK